MSDAIVIETERFDPAVRDKMAAFFRKAFARSVADRFEHAEDMRQAWLAALAPSEHVAGGAVVAEIDLERVRPETPIEAPGKERARPSRCATGKRSACVATQPTVRHSRYRH
jgi:hypothetical protein